jgi:spermidine synthase
MSVFPRMAEILPEGECGGARIYHTTYDEVTAASASYLGDRYVPTPAGTYASLLVRTESGNQECMMSDLAYERATCLEVVRRAHGEVLIAGLGLGMILHPILSQPDVRHVTVVEKYQDVVDLICPTLPRTDALALVTADIFDWRPPRGHRFDVIWFDIWPDVAPSRLEEMAGLHRRFAPYLNRRNPRCWMDSWHREETRRIRAAAHR